MHGDDVASAGVSVTTEIISKANEILLEIIKIHIDKKRHKAQEEALKDKGKKLPGGEVNIKKLKAGGNIAMLPSYDKSDYKELVKRAKKFDIPIATVQDKGKENTLSVFFNTKDKTALDSIVKDMLEQKLSLPAQAEKMITIEKTQVEGFQMYCADHDIPVSFMEAKDGVKCIFNGAYEQQIGKCLLSFPLNLFVLLRKCPHISDNRYISSPQLRSAILYGSSACTHLSIDYSCVQTFLGVFLTKRFGAYKSFLPGCFNRDILASLDFVPIIFKSLQQFIKRIDRAYQFVNSLPDLLFPRCTVLPLLPFIMLDRSTLILKVECMSDTKSSAYSVCSVTRITQSAAVGIELLPRQRIGIYDDVIMYMRLVNVRCYDRLHVITKVFSNKSLGYPVCKLRIDIL